MCGDSFNQRIRPPKECIPEDCHAQRLWIGRLDRLSSAVNNLLCSVHLSWQVRHADTLGRMAASSCHGLSVHLWCLSCMFADCGSHSPVAPGKESRCVCTVCLAACELSTTTIVWKCLAPRLSASFRTFFYRVLLSRMLQSQDLKASQQGPAEVLFSLSYLCYPQ